MKRIDSRACLAAALLMVLIGCQATDPTYRRQRLLELYPPGQTTRAQVQEKFSNYKMSQLSAIRTESGWNYEQQGVQARAMNDASIRSGVRASENRTGKEVYRCDCYWSPDPRASSPASLCFCWFYYDQHDILLDAEWQYASD